MVRRFVRRVVDLASRDLTARIDRIDELVHETHTDLAARLQALRDAVDALRTQVDTVDGRVAAIAATADQAAEGAQVVGVRVATLQRLVELVLTRQLRPATPEAQVPRVTVAATDVGPVLVPADDAWVAPTLLTEGRWEPAEAALIDASLQPGMVVVDIGAHVGYHTLRAARAVGPGGRVFALEPAPANFALLQANVELHGLSNVRAVAAVALSESGTAELSLSPDNSGDHRPGAMAGRVTTPVAAVAVDDLLGPSGRVDFVKCDAQGSDQAALRGMERALTRCHPTVVVEFWPEGIREFGDDPVEVVRYYRGLGYDLRVLEDDSVPADVDEHELVRLAESWPDLHYVTLVLRPR